MACNIRIVATYPPRKCGIGTFSRDLTTALECFSAEVGLVRVAAIDKHSMSYDLPVDIVIDQYNPQSWQKAAADIVDLARKSTDTTTVVLQHEYGLDPDKDGNDSRGTNFVEMAKFFRKNKLMTLVYLHTVLDTPNDHQRKVLLQLAEHCNAILVPTGCVADILESEAYGLRRSAIKHIDHGIRMRNPSEFDRFAIKKEYGLQDRLLVTTLGLHSPGKGIEYGIRAYASFLTESCTEAQRKRIVYLVAGLCHPEFVKAQDGKLYNEYMATLAKALSDSKLQSCKVNQLTGVDFALYDVVFLDTFLDEPTLLKLYSATNIMLLPYLNMQQISSGILADTLGAGRVAVTTKFTYARELIGGHNRSQPGIVIAPRPRGILVDPGPPSIEQMAQALDFLVFNKDERLAMEKRAHARGYQMRWQNTAWILLQYIQFLKDKNEIVTGRGIRFARQKSSVFELRNAKRSMKL